ncbi:MAG: deoxyhypusine synthase family protein [Thermodesulfobacteriota bacterium]|jgi:deoxyhypusine synthase|nr:deoxyhypusine synthase family protein [Thermodesulfobacteriota bacterium]|tara:strand:- start:1156 stop:2223 length:1068 start_codon:yes stop_codon:yes gene_type:complete
MKGEISLDKKVRAIDVEPNRPISDLLEIMENTGFQGKNLAKVVTVLEHMSKDPNITILFGYAGSLSTTGQWKIINWFLENNLIDILVPTGANISEDIVEAMGGSYIQYSHNSPDEELFKKGYNRYYDIIGSEKEYLDMTELIAEFIQTLDDKYNYSSREFLYLFGLWLSDKKIESIVSVAAKNNVPIFCPAFPDSPYGDAALIANAKGFSLTIDSIKDYREYMSLAEHVVDTGVVYIGGGVPKDWIQLISVTADLLYESREVPNRKDGKNRDNTGEQESYYPHKYAVQITTDSPQWGGLSGCTFEEAVSWGKEDPHGELVQCYCDASIALPIVSHALVERLKDFKREPKKLNSIF